MTTETINRLPHAFTRVETIARTWSGVDISYQEKYPAAGQSWADMLSAKTTTIVRLDQRGGRCEPRLRMHHPPTRSRYDAGFFNWIPAEQPLWCFSDGVHLLRDLHLSFDIDTLHENIGDSHTYAKLNEPQLLIYDSRVLRCAHALADACLDPFPNDRLYGESLTIATLTAILNAAENRHQTKRIGGLAPWQLRMAKDYLEENHAREVSLASLARLTGLSQSWFARRFKASTGIAPYTWVLQIRVRRAKELLAANRQPISSIAVEAGFADQSHFTKAFKRFAGATPRDWREANKK